MVGRTLIRRLFQLAIAYAVVWSVCIGEFMICGTAYGGPFTIFMAVILHSLFAGLAVVLALVIGLFLLIPGIRDLWKRIGYGSLLLSAAALALMIFASPLGLRTIDPASNYRLMPFWIWSLCLVAIGFPIVNLPAKYKDA